MKLGTLLKIPLTSGAVVGVCIGLYVTLGSPPAGGHVGVWLGMLLGVVIGCAALIIIEDQRARRIAELAAAAATTKPSKWRLWRVGSARRVLCGYEYIGDSAWIGSGPDAEDRYRRIFLAPRWENPTRGAVASSDRPCSIFTSIASPPKPRLSALGRLLMASALNRRAR